VRFEDGDLNPERVHRRLKFQLRSP